MENFKRYIGRYFERDIGENSDRKEVFKIKRYDGKHFIVNMYGLNLDSSTLNINQKMRKSFITKDNFKEITENEYDAIVSLCKDLYVTDWTEENAPRYYRILKDNKTIASERN